MFPKRLKDARKNAGLTLDELAARYNQRFGGGLNKSTLSKYENNRQQPLSRMIVNLADLLNVSTDYLLGPPDEKYSLSNPQTREAEHLERALTKIPMFTAGVSAGLGAWLDEGREYEFVSAEDVPSGADFALRVRGDSMEPMYSDGDTVFVKAGVIVESGQIGVFCLNDEGYLKMLQGNKLVSLNSAYKPISVGEFDNFFCAGRVVGKT
jgi:phage repressor protein C with HTH and peptisase S24 domain